MNGWVSGAEAVITVSAYKEGHTDRDKSHISTTSHIDLKSSHPSIFHKTLFIA